MHQRPMCRLLRYAHGSMRAGRWTACSSRAYCNTLINTGFIDRRCRTDETAAASPHPRQAGCMAKTERRKKAARLPKQIELATQAAEDKKAVDLIVLDLRKAAGFTDYFVICSGTNARQVRAIADGVVEA